MNTLNKILLLFSISLALFSCNEKKPSAQTSAVAEDVIEKDVSGVDRLKDEASKYNSLYAGEARASLSENNPMPNIHQDIDTINKMYVFDYIWYEPLSPIDNLDHKAGMRNVLNEMSKNPQPKNFMQLLANEGYGIRFNVEGSESGKKVTNEVSTEEIKKLISLSEYRR